MRDRLNQAPREPLLSAPPLVLLIPVVLIALYGLEVLAGPIIQKRLVESYALSPLLLRQGDYDLLISYLFLHGSWVHVLFNSAFCLAFATPVVRACGPTWRGGLSFLTFYLLCGIVAGLGYCLLNMNSPDPVLGASGAISGLMGAGIRLNGDPYDPPAIKPLMDSRVLSMTIFWCGMNALIPVVRHFTAPTDLIVAWQAHVVGYLFGLLAVSPWLHLFHRRYFTTK